jgi:uncharacterized protein
LKNNKPEIFVDGDACPVKKEILRVAERHELPVHMVSNRWISLPDSPLINRKIVPKGADQADDWIAESIEENDIAVTADIPLASRCLSKKAKVIGPSGKNFDEDNIGMALAMRELNSYLREVGEIQGNGASFSKKDRSRFLCALEETIQSILRNK